MKYVIIERKILLLSVLNEEKDTLEIESFQPYTLNEKGLLSDDEFKKCRLASGPGNAILFRCSDEFEFFYDYRRIIVTALKESTFTRCIELFGTVITDYNIEYRKLGCNQTFVVAFQAEEEAKRFCSYYVPLSNWGNILGEKADVARFQVAKAGEKDFLIPERIINVNSVTINSQTSEVEDSGVKISDIYNFDISVKYTLNNYIDAIETTLNSSNSTIEKMFGL